jgi:hypothetical protein
MRSCRKEVLQEGGAVGQEGGGDVGRREAAAPAEPRSTKNQNQNQLAVGSWQLPRSQFRRLAHLPRGKKGIRAKSKKRPTDRLPFFLNRRHARRLCTCHRGHVDTRSWVRGVFLYELVPSDGPCLWPLCDFFVPAGNKLSS